MKRVPIKHKESLARWLLKNEYNQSGDVNHFQMRFVHNAGALFMDIVGGGPYERIEITEELYAELSRVWPLAPRFHIRINISTAAMLLDVLFTKEEIYTMRAQYAQGTAETPALSPKTATIMKLVLALNALADEAESAWRSEYETSYGLAEPLPIEIFNARQLVDETIATGINGGADVFCEWTDMLNGLHETSCGKFVFYYLDYAVCPYCGRSLIVNKGG